MVAATPLDTWLSGPLVHGSSPTIHRCYGFPLMLDPSRSFALPSTKNQEPSHNAGDTSPIFPSQNDEKNDEKCRHNEICRSFRVQWPRVNSHLSMAPRGCPKSSGSQDPRVPGKPRCSLASRGDGYLNGRDLTSHVTRMMASKENYPQINGRKFQLSEILQFTQICDVCDSMCLICWKIWSI